VLDTVVQRFLKRDETEQEQFRGQLAAYRSLYAFLSQMIPYQDSDLEKLYAFVRNLISKLPPPGDGKGFAVDDEIALRYFRLQQMTEGSIDLSDGEAAPLKGPTDVGTGRAPDEEVALSNLIEKLNERFGTDFTEADQLFFDQIRASAEQDDKIVEAARANNLANFSSFLERMLDELFIDRMEGNEEIFSRVMTDKEFRAAAHEHLAHEIFRRTQQHDNVG
jgi:type I restriction enzyme R subunit